MSAQELEQRARELLPELPPMAMTVAGDDPDAGHWYRAEQMRDYAASAVAAALRQQPAPVDLEQFREAVACWHDAALPANSVDAERKAEAKRLLSIIDNAGKVEACKVVVTRDDDHEIVKVEHNGEVVAQTVHAGGKQPAPVVDDARMARALEWVRTAARGNVGEGDALRAALIESARKHLPAIEEAIAAYNPNCGARTVCGVDDAMRDDAQRYRWLRSGKYELRFARSVLNDSPEGIDAAIDAARAQGVQS